MHCTLLFPPNKITVTPLLYGLPDSKLQRLQKMPNLAASIVSRTPKYDHISPVLKALHWLPVKARILIQNIVT